MNKVAGYIILCLIWGTTWMGIKIGLDDLNPFLSLGIRFLIASGCIGGYLLLRDRTPLFRREQIGLILWITLFNYIFPYSLVYWGEQFIHSNLTAVIYATMPLNIAVLTPFFLRSERLTAYDYTGTLIGFFGTVLIFADSLFAQAGFHLWGVIALYLAAILSSIASIIIKNYRGDYHPLKINFIPMLITGIAVTLISLFFEDIGKNRWTLKAVSSILYLAIPGTVFAFAIYFWMIRQVRLIILSSITYVIPIIAIIAGWIFLREELTQYQAYGSLLVITGVFVAARRPSRRTTVPVKPSA